MGLIKSNTQRGKENYIYECCCGSHMIRLVKDTPFKDWPIQHSIEFWEYRGVSYRTVWDRILLGINIILGRKGKYPIYEILLENDDVEALGNAVLSLKTNLNTSDEKNSAKKVNFPEPGEGTIVYRR